METLTKNLDDFLEALKEETLPGVWSKGVQYSRAVNSMELVSSDLKTSELKFKIKTQERLLAFSVTLWINDHDSHCNCGSKVEPCHHIVAIGLALQNGSLNLNKPSSAPKLEYQWKIDESSGKIQFLRWIVSESGRSPLTQTLLSYISGVQSGRITGKLPATTSLDLKIDEVLSRAHALETRTSWKELLQCVAELPEVSGYEVIKGSARPTLRIIDAETRDQGIRFLKAPLTPADRTFAHGVELIGNQLRIAPEKPPFTIPEQIQPGSYEKFLSESLPLLHDYFEVVNESKFLPQLVDRDPEVVYEMVTLEDGRVAITPSISYGPPSDAELPRRDKTQEQELMRDLRQNKHLVIGQTTYLSPRELFQRRNTAPEIEAFASQYFSGLMSEIGVDFKRVNLEEQEQTILHLFALKEKESGTSQIQTLARSLNAPLDSQTRAALEPVAPPQVPRSLWEKLRDYQKQGVYWLAGQSGSGAILADDMGLGKTIQTLAVVQPPALIVAPTSLLHNWKTEAARFRPDFSVNVFHGSGRQWSAEADLTITSYGLLTKLENEKPWNTMVLDEAHLIRNQDTIAAQAAFATRASVKIALTGTPIQNKRADLLSLFQFVSPGLFANESEMKPELVAPFILRRKKEEVLKELPPKTYLLHDIELKEFERSRYKSTWAAAKAEILQQLSATGSEGKKSNPLSMFEALLRARQACDHSGLFLPSDWKLQSSKLVYLLQLIGELREAGHSVLVYSQWTKFLDRIEEELSQVPYERLDGSTSNRGKVVENFQNSSEAKVFLLSLHAGGVGLNLTRASHVIFCDPWWNPFVELQAEDRAYRMGQEKPVTIHRLICEETVEEKLLKIQAIKKETATQAISDEAGPSIAFTEADLLGLLQE